MSDLSLPPDYAPGLPEAAKREINIVKLAREIAMDLRELDQILEHHLIDRQAFEQLKRNPYFCRVLSSEVEAWQSATNTGERVKLKAAAMMEELLPTLFERIVNPKEDLMKVVKGGELVTKLAGLNAEDNKNINPSDKVVITINMGADNKLQIAKQVTPQVIDHEPLDPVQEANELQQNLFEASIDVSSD
jgi:hypothetical protein